MGYETGAVKYAFNSILFNYSAMYVFGGGIITAFTILVTAGSGDLGTVLVNVLMPTPESLVVNPIVGAPIAALKWYTSVT